MGNGDRIDVVQPHRHAATLGTLTDVVPRTDLKRKKAITARATSSSTNAAMSRRVRCWRSSSARLIGPSMGTAWVWPVTITAWVAPTWLIMEVRAGSPASTGRPSAKRNRSARNCSAVA